jgi:glycosyltransferase involved in cell wall biosynthesis
LTQRRVLLLSYEFAPFRGGIARVAEALATGAAGLGHDVHLLAPDYLADQSGLDQRFPFAVHRFRGDFCSILSIDKLSRFARLCRRTIARTRPDVVHATDPQSHMALTLLSWFFGAPPFSVTVHGTELLRYRSETLPRLWMQRAFRRPLAIFPVSDAVRQILIRSFDTDPARVRVAYPAVAPLWFDTPPADRSAVRTRWGVPENAFLLITVARRVPDKGHARVIDALATLPQAERAGITYLVAGRGPDAYARQLQALAERNGVHLVLAGETDDAETVALVDAADLFVMTSLQTAARLEGLGIAFLEAAARARPAIASATGGTREAVIPDVTGLVIPEPCPPDSLAAAIQSLVTDRDRLRQLGDQARLHASGFTAHNLARAVFG